MHPSWADLVRLRWWRWIVPADEPGARETSVGDWGVVCTEQGGSGRPWTLPAASCCCWACAWTATTTRQRGRRLRPGRGRRCWSRQPWAQLAQDARAGWKPVAVVGWQARARRCFRGIFLLQPYVCVATGTPFAGDSLVVAAAAPRSGGG